MDGSRRVVLATTECVCFGIRLPSESGTSAVATRCMVTLLLDTHAHVRAIHTKNDLVGREPELTELERFQTLRLLHDPVHKLQLMQARLRPAARADGADDLAAQRGHDLRVDEDVDEGLREEVCGAVEADDRRLELEEGRVVVLALRAGLLGAPLHGVFVARRREAGGGGLAPLAATLVDHGGDHGPRQAELGAHGATLGQQVLRDVPQRAGDQPQLVGGDGGVDGVLDRVAQPRVVAAQVFARCDARGHARSHVQRQLLEAEVLPI